MVSCFATAREKKLPPTPGSRGVWRWLWRGALLLTLIACACSSDEGATANLTWSAMVPAEASTAWSDCGRSSPDSFCVDGYDVHRGARAIYATERIDSRCARERLNAIKLARPLLRRDPWSAADLPPRFVPGVRRSVAGSESECGGVWVQYESGTLFTAFLPNTSCRRFDSVRPADLCEAIGPAPSRK